MTERPFPPQASPAPQPAPAAGNFDPNYQLAPEEMQPKPEQVLLAWKAPNRPYKKRNRQFYVTVAMIVFLISLILFFAGQFLPIAVVIAIAFLGYVLNAVPPEMVVNQVTTYGIRTDGVLFPWEELSRFWYGQKHQDKTLHVEVNHFPNQLTLLLASQPEEEVTKLLSQVLLHEKPSASGFDKASQWLQEKIPLDTEA